jgi:CII-binding regulator of phage lambda lysogenization HflD
LLSKPTYQQTQALAAIFQSASQVYMLAYTGESDAAKTKFAMATLLNQNPDSLEDLYGAKENLEEGFSTYEPVYAKRQSRPLRCNIKKLLVM